MFFKGWREPMALTNGWFVKYGIFPLTLLLVCLVPMVGSGATQQSSYVILIDPAHGGEDQGVLSDKLREKDLTLNMALLVRQEAQKIPGLQVQLTRSVDRAMTIAERVKAAGTMRAGCLVSLHVNAGFGKKATGYEIYFPGFRQAASEGGDSSPILKDMVRNKSLNNSVRLAQEIQSGLETVFPRKGRGLRDAPSPLLDGLSVPGLVVEVGFATNPDDRKNLTELDTQQAVARALAKSLRDYIRKTPAL
jgi:N-acetylmuramoyl-L-alanine amidase